MNTIDKQLLKILEKANSKSFVTKKMIHKLKKVKSSKLDEFFHLAHKEVFQRIDCLQCANCCKSISPGINETDINRMAKHLKIKRNDLIEHYLIIDKDEDYVFKISPCPFLMEDNYCSIYESRPKACREYPHTDRRKMSQILNLTYNNSLYCPAVFEILQLIDKKL